MGRQAIITMLCLLATKESLSELTVLNNLAQDNVSAESAPRLYRSIPVYASSAPYAAYSIQIPSFITAPKAAASRIIPVKEVFQNTGYLRDSYGNRFEGAPHAFGYKAAFPQQFLQLQELPSHLAQPLVAAAPSYQYKHPSPFMVGSHYTLPLQGISSHRFSAPQQVAYPDTIKNIAPASSHQAQVYGHSTAQQQPTSNKAVYTNVQSQEQYRGLNNGQPFQRLQEVPKDVQIIQKDATRHNKQVIHNHNERLQATPGKDGFITTVVNGQKTVINLQTKPSLPLLDISLLEPLTFDNPLVPQVQHFLPRINQATYHKLPKPNVNENKKHQKEFVQKTKSYSNGAGKGKSRKVSPKKKEKRPSPESDTHEIEGPVNPTVTIKDVSNVSPEISYEINSPNYKETYKEQAISYNKETQSEPLHYTYGSKTEKEPVHYSYVHSSKEPLKIKEAHYENNGQDPKQLIYNFKTAESPQEQNDKQLTPLHESKNFRENDESEEEHLNHRPKDHREELLKTHHHNPEHREEEYHHPSNHEQNREVPNNPDHFYSQPRQNSVKNGEQFHPVTQYEENIRLIPEHKTAHIKVDPGQHIQNGQAHHNPQSIPSPDPQEQSNQSLGPDNYQHDHPSSSSRPHNTAPQHIQEKSRRVIIQEETPEEMHSLREMVMAEMIDQEENDEEDFEKGYKNAAYGFPAYRKEPVDTEKEIYNPESYGVPHDHSDYNIEHVPFEQYQDEGDEYPKTMRSNYKDAKDKTKENYYLDFAVSRPESLTDRYRNKEDYYKLFKEQKPERYTTQDDDRKEQNEKYRADQYVFKPVPEQKHKQTFAQYKAAPKLYEYDYSKEAPRDNSAYASRPLQQYKTKTYFVEPQFQYGFEPLIIPRLLDSELAAMATNHSPENEKPGMRKKVYKENWYIKKTRTAGGDNR